MKRGFVTIATGNEQYYKIAYNLLRSYRYFSAEPLPFAIVCDKENSFTEAFDDVIILENATRSYIDKLSLLKVIPYEETIFIDADCLAYADLNVLFDMFDGADDVSCFGKVLPRESEEGFFKLGDIGQYADKVQFCISMHGGIMFFRKSDILTKVYDACCEIKDHYYDYKFRYFRDPADEPLMALSMAIYGLRPIPTLNPSKDAAPIFSFYPVDGNGLYADILNGKVRVKRGQFRYSAIMVHFGTVSTKEKMYLLEEENLNLLCDGKTSKNSLRAFFKPYRISLFADNMRKKYKKWLYNTKCTVKPIIMKLLRRK